MTPIDDFVAEIKVAANGQSRVDLDTVWRVFLRCRPELASSPNKRSELARWLGLALEARAFVQPKGKRLFDRTAAPPLPIWVALPIQKVVATSFDHRAYPWHPSMTFVAGLKLLPSPEDALALNRFFVERGDPLLVPAKERSYSIFGDEKRLAAVLDGVLAAGLSFEKLKCYAPAFVPVHRIGNPLSKRVLILENEAAFDTFCRWNHANQVWNAIVFGRGLEVWKTVSFLCEGWTDQATYEYFGDFDQEGVCIAYRLAESLKKHARILVPLKAAYRFLIKEPFRDDEKTHTTDWPIAIQWFDDADVIAAARIAFAANRRVAQEAFGWEQVSALDATAFSGLLPIQS